MYLRYTSVICIGVLFVATAARAETPFDPKLPHISGEDASKHYGERCVVYGTVVAARDIGKRTFLNFTPEVRTGFTIVVEQAAYGKFPEPPVQTYLNHPVRVVGTIVEFKEKAEIIIEGPDQIEIMATPDIPAGMGVTAAPSLAASAAPSPAPAATPAPSPDAKPATTSGSPAPSTPQVASRAPAAGGEVVLMEYNLHNLFDQYDDPYFVNENPAKPEEELKLIAATIRKMQPDIVAFEEVENRQVLQEFADKHLGDMKFNDVVLYPGNSDRGINVGLISRLPVGPVTSYRHLRLKQADGKPTHFQRDLLQVRIEPDGFCPFDVFVVHLKSKLGEDTGAGAIRLAEATAIRRIFDERLKAEPKSRFVITGDFNDLIDSPSVKTILGDGPQALKTFVAELPADRAVTFNREPYRSMIDFFFASPAFGEGYVAGSYTTVPGSMETSGSDHNPVVVHFKLPKAGSCN
jgi:endonuclease/exonuclease/phosphatase family metal-dependent hydrolase